MIASTPVRLLSLVIVAVFSIVGIRGIVGGLAGGGDLLDATDRYGRPLRRRR